MCPWLSGKVFDLRSKGGWYKTHLRHCFVSLSKTLYFLLRVLVQTRKTGNCHGMTETSLNGMLCPGHTFTDHLTVSTTDQIPRMTTEMTISVA